MGNIIKHSYQITIEDRNKLNNHSSFLIWFTGLSGSGKSTIANQLEVALHQKGFRTYSLDGDNIRKGLNSGLGFSQEDRRENLRRIAEVSKLFVDAGIITIAAFVSPLIEHREFIKSIVGKENFLEIYVKTPIEVCEERDVKGLYKKARQGEIKNFTGIDSPYEAPLNPNVEIKTVEMSVEESVGEIMDFLTQKMKLQ